MNYLFKSVFNFTFNGMTDFSPAWVTALCRIITEAGAQQQALIGILVSYHAYPYRTVINIFPMEISFSKTLFNFLPHPSEQTKNMQSFPLLLAFEPSLMTASAPIPAAISVILSVAVDRALPIISAYSVNSPPRISLTMADRSLPSHTANTVCP